MTAAAEFLGDPEIEADRFGVADMQIAVGLGREAGHHLAGAAGGEIGRDDVADEVAPALRRYRLDPTHSCPLPLAAPPFMWPIARPAPSLTKLALAKYDCTRAAVP